MKQRVPWRCLSLSVLMGPAGCVVTPVDTVSVAAGTPAPGPVSAAAAPVVATTAKPRASAQVPVAASLQAQLAQWQGVPYRYGGMSRRGVTAPVLSS
ncbi:MAG: hypothetical protein R3292_00635 [Alcanivorax sp.]|nr:hypothetical protein [Alcanivorax sp.]